MRISIFVKKKDFYRKHWPFSKSVQIFRPTSGINLLLSSMKLLNFKLNKITSHWDTKKNPRKKCWFSVWTSNFNHWFRLKKFFDCHCNTVKPLRSSLFKIILHSGPMYSILYKCRFVRNHSALLFVNDQLIYARINRICHFSTKLSWNNVKKKHRMVKQWIESLSKSSNSAE